MNKQRWYLIGKIGLGVAVVLGLFWYMSLAVFLGLCVLLMVRLALVEMPIHYSSPTAHAQRWRAQRVLHYGSVALAGVAALVTLYHYWGAPTRIFKNADHHALAHLGFQFGQSLTLADDQHPQQALWDTKRGRLRVLTESNDFRLAGERFHEPIFVRQEASYTLANAPIGEAFDSTLSVEFVGGRQLTLSVQHLNDEAVRYQYRYTDGDSVYATRPIAFNKVIRTGLPLRDLIGRNPVGTARFVGVLALLDSAYLVREQYLGQDNDDNQSPLRLFPSRHWADSVVALSVDGVDVSLTRSLAFEVPLRSEQSFFVGLRTKRTRTYSLRRLGEQSALYLGFPERNYLRSSAQAQETLFLTSSVDRVSQSQLFTGLLLEGPTQENNLNHLSANLSYRTGHTTEQMRFRVVNEVAEGDLTNTAAQVVAAGDTLRLASTGVATNASQGVYWLLSVIDLKATNGMPWWALVGYVLGFVVLALVALSLTPVGQSAQALKVEVGVYITLLAFMVVRTVILWRAVTFVPLEDVSPIDYETLRGLGKYFRLQVWFTLVFFGIIIGLKKWKPKAGILQKIEAFFISSPMVAFGLFGLYLLVGLKGVGSLERLVSVLVPVSVYFLIDFVFHRRAVAQYTYATYSPEYRFVSKLNWIIALAAFALGDAGFGIVFIVFSLIYWFLRVRVFPDHRLQTQLPKHKIALALWPYRGFLIAISLTAFIWVSPWLLSAVFRHLTAAIMLILVGLGVFCWREKYLLPKLRIGIVALLVVAVGLVIPFEQQLQKIATTKNRMLYRAEVRFRTAGDIIAAEQFNLGNDRRLLNAAQNQWFIRYFRGKSDLSVINYFKRVPHFQQGSSYLTQISDLVSVRYVIAEHSEWVLIGLILLLSGLVFLAVRNQMAFHSHTKLRVQLLCFLFSLALAIWLTASDRMVFVGQDFPMLSMNSYLTLIVGFGVMLMVVWAGYGRPTDIEATAQYNTFEAKGALRFGSWAVQLVIGIAFWAWVLAGKNQPKFDLITTIEHLEQIFEGLNEKLEDFQQNVVKNPKERSPVALMNDFENYRQREMPDFFKNNPFAQSAYQAFITRYIQDNNPEQLIHLRKNEYGRYEFAINRFFYNVNSPDVLQNGWQGHLVANSTYRSLSLASLQHTTQVVGLDTTRSVSRFGQLLTQRQLLTNYQHTNVRLSLVPAGWTKDSLPVLIVGRTQGEEARTRSAFLVKNGTELLASQQSRHAIVLRPNDVLHLQSIPSETQKPEVVSFRLAQKEEGYLAKNVWLNGRPQYFYPLQERFLWSYFFTNLLKTRYDDQADMRKVNVALSLDPALMSQVYDRVHAYQSPGTASPKRGFSLVVLDSDGQLKALSDYKTDARLRINPNRMNDYEALFEELYMDESVMNERSLFGNRCLMRMPNGPASTFKPILYGAVTSQYDLDWPNLRFGGIGNYPSKKSGSRGDQEIRHFGGNDMRLTVGANNLGEHDNLFYLSQSTNTYNTMMVYLGSLTPTQLDKVANGLRTVSPSEYLQVGAHPTNPKFNFPLVKYSTNLFRIDKMPAWDEKNSLLSVGLSENFHLPTTSNAEMADLEQRNIALGLPGASFSASKSVFKLWSFPEASHLLMIDRTTGMQNAVPQIAMGAYPISITPVKMAEMAAQLFSFNPNFQTSVLAQPQQQAKKPFSVGQNWQGENNLLAFYSNNLFKAMHLAVQNGTAQFIKETQNGYYFYAKTGTGSGNRQAGDSRDKNLMLIISKNQLHDTNLTVESIQQNKFYVVYFSFYNDSSEGDWEINAKKVVREIIQLVQASAGFRRMMMTDKAN